MARSTTMAIQRCCTAQGAVGRAPPRRWCVLAMERGSRDNVTALVALPARSNDDQWPTGPAPARPERIGRYRVVERIGRGAHGRRLLGARRSHGSRRGGQGHDGRSSRPSRTFARASCAKPRSLPASPTATSSPSTTSAKTTGGSSSSWSSCAGRPSQVLKQRVLALEEKSI